jgi:hypothetical protein
VEIAPRSFASGAIARSISDCRVPDPLLGPITVSAVSGSSEPLPTITALASRHVATAADSGPIRA